MHPQSALETALRRDRVLVAAGLGTAIVLSWAYLVPTSLDMYGSMSGPSAWMMAARWDVRFAVLVFLMWWVMMIAMMVPSAAPAILLYGRTVRSSAVPVRPVARTYAFALGYVGVWGAFSMGATALQGALAGMALVSPMMETASRTLAAVLLIAAGVYQWTRVKQLCLTRCRSPLQWLSRHWRPGVRGALAMGASHGGFCVGCCWALMLLLFVGGVMNLLWIVVIAALVFVEKATPYGALIGRWIGVALAVAGVWLVI